MLGALRGQQQRARQGQAAPKSFVVELTGNGYFQFPIQRNRRKERACMCVYINTLLSLLAYTAQGRVEPHNTHSTLLFSLKRDLFESIRVIRSLL